LREVSCQYRFGRVELLPVKKTAQAVGFYLGDYLVKTYNLIPPGQRCRLVRFSRRINRSISTKFSIHGLGQLIYRTRLKMAAGMLNFKEYEDFAEYFGPRWNFYLKNAMAWIPIPFRFQKDAFKSGFAGIVLADYAESPEKYLDERGKAKLGDVSRELWRRLNESVNEDATEEQLQRQAMRLGDNVGDGHATPEGLQEDLFRPMEVPF
jgi:hypothetical protein